MRSKIILVLAILMGAITTFLFYQYISQFSEETLAVENHNLVEVVVAKDQIKRNQYLQSSMFELVKLPEQSVHPQAIRQIPEATGMYATSEIHTGEQVLGHRIQQQKFETTFVSRKIREGRRGVSIGVNFVQSVSNLIEPEDIVDVIFSERKEINGNNTIASELLLYEVRVLAVGRRMIEAEDGQTYAEYSSVTLELNAADAVKLVNASERGTIQLILHGKEEHINE